MGSLLYAIVLSMLPVSEVRGGIPYAMLSGIPWYVALPVCAAANMLIVFPLYLFLNTVNQQFMRIGIYRKLFTRYIERVRKRGEKVIQKYGYPGLIVFVAVPLPVTGAYTGTVLSWLLGMQQRKSFFFIAAGVLMASVIVSLVMLFGIETFSFVIKNSFS